VAAKYIGVQVGFVGTTGVANSRAKSEEPILLPPAAATVSEAGSPFAKPAAM
jgi:hypothetical protein